VHALECNYDGIIIGAGHHGLVLGAYLAKAGLDILIVERRLDYGGGLCTKEVTEPGFYITTCSPSITSTLARRRGSRTSVSANV
jgi:phytoene dehydrogenase-like protein